MIEIKNLTKNYERVNLYNGFDLEIKEGEITCILGESGSGKTTLLNCIAKLTDYSGFISPVKCSYIFQSPRLVPNLTVFGNLRLVCGDKDKIINMLERVKILDKANEYPSKLSGGQAQRVAIARAFLYDSSVILMDEPFASLDLKLKKEIYDLFIEMRSNDGRTAILVTHDVDEAAVLAQHVVVLKNGKANFSVAVESGVNRSEEEKERLRKLLILKLLED